MGRNGCFSGDGVGSSGFAGGGGGWKGERNGMVGGSGGGEAGMRDGDLLAGKSGVSQNEGNVQR
jgi:hypothetical protein